MADALVKELNRLGYQPVFLPRTGVEPPELYNFAQGRLIRRGPLASYLPASLALTRNTGQLGDISYHSTSGKHAQAAVNFLQQALRCIGIDAVPTIDLGFSGASEFAFSFTGVSYIGVDPSELDHNLASLSTTGIPQEYVDGGRLHIAYEYAYATTLLMTRADRKAFDHDISGRVGEFIDVGTSGKVQVENGSTISFGNASDAPAAFAYKAGRLEQRDGGTWAFFPEEVSEARGIAPPQTLPYLIARGVVIPVVED